MLAKFLVVEESTSIAPHSTVKVKLKDAGTSNVGFIFPTVEFAARGLILANAGLLLGPAEARVYNTKDVNQNISAGECIVMNVQMEGEGLKGEGLENAAASEAAAVETNESSETETAAETSEAETTETDENAEASEAASEETDASPENTEGSEAEETEEETPKKSSRSKK